MFYRHNRVWLSKAGWQRALEAVPDAHIAEVQQWADNQWPATVRRNEPGMARNSVCLGIALPPPLHEGRKIRIPFTAGVEDVLRRDTAVDLAAVVPAMPAAWQTSLGALSQAACHQQLLFRVYGAAALQVETRLPYLSASSDIDLLFYPASEKQLEEGLALLLAHTARLPLDGEIVFPSGRAVAWKEWMYASDNQSGTRVLTKNMQDVSLTPVADLRSELQSRPWKL